MRDTITPCIGWFIRRTKEATALARFYRGVLGLPLLRSIPTDDPSMVLLWAGDSVVLEILPGGRNEPPREKVLDEPVVPVFRVHGLPELVDRLRHAGVKALEDRADRDGRTLFFRDPAGLVTGLCERRQGSPSSEDVESRRRRDAREKPVNGIPPMPREIQNLGWLILHVADVTRARAFYRDVIGLEVVADAGEAGVELRLGDTARLELRPGGRIETAATGRRDSSYAWVLRVGDLDALVDSLMTKEVRFVERPFEIGGRRIAYVVDPEGHLLGIQGDPPEPVHPEDIEAARRRARAWKERTARSRGAA